MLYIVSKTPVGEEVGEVWHVDKPAPRTLATKVIEIQADGDELDYILRRFTNLPTPWLQPGRIPSVVWWFGSTAQFIVANLG